MSNYTAAVSKYFKYNNGVIISDIILQDKKGALTSGDFSE
jgi:hypothetical protein